MAISFLSVPSGVKVPGVYVEFDSSKANQGPAIQRHRVLLVGQKLSAGTKPVDEITLVSSADQAGEFFGRGSMLYHMAKTFLAENKINELNCVALADGAGAVAADGSYELTAAATDAGTLALYIGGREYKVAVASGDTESAIITALIAAVNADTERYVNAAVDGGNADQMNLVARELGLAGNDIDIRENYFAGQELPAGLASTIVAMNSGSSNPDLADLVAAMGEVQYHEIVIPYSDAANLLVMETEMVDRWGPIRANDGHVFYGRKESFANHISHLGTRNNAQETVMNIAGPTPHWEWMSNLAAVVSKEAQADPARPFQTSDLSRVKAPKQSELFTHGERNQILVAGGSTFNVTPSGIPEIERVRTTRVENDFAAPDESLADLNPKMTLSYLRFDFRTNHLTKFSKHKLVDDGQNIGPGQAVITPKIAKAEAIAKFRDWETLGLVENIGQYSNDMIVERNISDPTRLDYLLSPDLANQLRVAGVQIAFLL